MKIYISGKMKGLSAEEYLKNFNDAEEYLLQRGFTDVVNPAKLYHQALMASIQPTYRDALATDIAMLATCDVIYMLANWTDSPGAMAELSYAKACDILIIYENRKNIINANV